MPVWTLVRSSREGAPNPRSGPKPFDLSSGPDLIRPSTKLLGGLRLPSVRGLLVLRNRAIALLEASAAPGITSLLEGRRKVVAAAISAAQLLRLGRCTR